MSDGITCALCSRLALRLQSQRKVLESTQKLPIGRPIIVNKLSPRLCANDAL